MLDQIEQGSPRLGERLADRAADRDRETLRRIDATLLRLVKPERHLEAEITGHEPEED